MRRATITLPDDLEADLDDYLASRDAPPSLTSLVQAALRRYLEEEARPPGDSVDRPYPTGPARGTSEIAEPVARYGSSGGGAPPPRAPASSRRLGDLPELLSSLPRLSEAEADSFADDLAAARRGLEVAAERARSGRPDPWTDHPE
jgi:hypothetical protein